VNTNDGVKAGSTLLLTTVLLTLLISSFGTLAHAFTDGQSASLVIGQKDFTSSSVGLSQSGLSGPNYAVIDSSGNLWVGDYLNSRVLEFKPPFSIGHGCIFGDRSAKL
jgi:hypothetical protein